jgi:hypothetical protein
VDHTKSFIGGINVYDALKHDDPIPQLDFAAYIEGTVTVDITNYCRLVFKRLGEKNYIMNILLKTIRKNFITKQDTMLASLLTTGFIAAGEFPVSIQR